MLEIVVSYFIFVLSLILLYNTSIILFLIVNGWLLSLCDRNKTDKIKQKIIDKVNLTFDLTKQE